MTIKNFKPGHVAPSKIFLVLLAICLIWGFNFVVMKTAAGFFSPESFVTYRFLLGAIVLLAVTIFAKIPLPDKKFWAWIILSGICQISLGGLIVQYALEYLNSGLVSVLNYTMPVWVTVLAKFFLDEDLTKKKIFGIALSIIGVGVLMNVDVSGSFAVMLIALSAAMFWAVGNVIMKAKLMKCNLIALTTWQMIFGGLLLGIYLFLFGTYEVTWTPISILCLLYNGIIASALAFVLWCYVLSHMEAGKASISVLGVPIFSVIFGVIFFGEPLTIFIIAGMFMVMSGIVLVQHS